MIYIFLLGKETYLFYFTSISEYVICALTKYTLFRGHFLSQFPLDEIRIRREICGPAEATRASLLFIAALDSSVPSHP